MSYDQNNPYGQPPQNNPYGQPPQNDPYAQTFNPYGQPVQPVQPQTSIALSILSFVFALVSIFIYAIGGTLAFDEREEIGVFFIAIAVIMVVLSLIFGIVGLVKSIKGHRAGGIVFAAIGLCFAVVEVFLFSVTLVEAIDYLDRVTRYYYHY